MTGKENEERLAAIEADEQPQPARPRAAKRRASQTEPEDRNESRVRFWLGNRGRESERLYDKQLRRLTYLRNDRCQHIEVDLRHGEWEPLGTMEVAD